ncbi:MAG: 16S rRNA (adenine(1518)-N(6)/adenine(1519)-N(6))-dimethyltransferase RsmA [Candidatus Thorarchaeota archaeon]
MNYKDVQLILKKLNIKPRKHLGQNFLIDKSVTNKIIKNSELSENDIVLEIGPGLGALTHELINKVKKIYAVEIDHTLYKYLSDIFSTYKNIEIINGDILEVQLPDHNKVISNLPYTITGPILEKVFFKKNAPLGILTIEKALGNRIFLSDNYKLISRISVTVNSFMTPIIKYDIPRKSFYPLPNIDLLLIKIAPKKDINIFLTDLNSRDFFLKFTAGIMPYKGKNIINAVTLYFKSTKQLNYSKENVSLILKKAGYENKKLFKFKNTEIIEICRLFYP